MDTKAQWSILSFYKPTSDDPPQNILGRICPSYPFSSIMCYRKNKMEFKYGRLGSQETVWDGLTIIAQAILKPLVVETDAEMQIQLKV